MRANFSFLITFFFFTLCALQTLLSADDASAVKDVKKIFAQLEQKKEKENLVPISSSPMDYITKSFYTIYYHNFLYDNL